MAKKKAALKKAAPKKAAPKKAAVKTAALKKVALKKALTKKSAPKKAADKLTTAAKPSVKNRSLSTKRTQGKPGMPSSPGAERDIKNRTGNFEGKGQPARKGGRASGIVGQTRSRFKTDKSR